MKYEWDPKLLKELKKDKKIAEELEGIYHPYESPFVILQEILFNNQFALINIEEDSMFSRKIEFYKPCIDTIIDYNENALKDTELLKPNSFNIKFNEDKVVDLTYKFYKETVPEDLFEKFYSVFQQRFQNLRFKRHNKYSFYSGITHYSPTMQKAFIEIWPEHSIVDVSVLIHEYGHAIGSQYWFSADSKCDEIESIFMEMLSFDYFDKYDELREDNYSNKLYFFNDFIDTAYNLNNKMDIANSYDKIKKTYYQKFIDILAYLSINTNISKSEIRTMSQNLLEQYFPYNYSTLVAMELYHIYLNYPSLAFELYKRIVKITAVEPERHYNEIKKLGINLTEHIDTFAKTLKR